MKELKKITFRSVTEKIGIIPQNALKHIMGGYDGWDGCGCSGSYCERSTGQITVCCGMDMETCYNFAKNLWYGTEAHSCGNCAG